MAEEFNQEIKPFILIEPKDAQKYHTVFKNETEFLSFSPEVKVKRIFWDKLNYDDKRMTFIIAGGFLYSTLSLPVGILAKSPTFGVGFLSTVLPFLIIGVKIIKRKTIKEAKIVSKEQEIESLKITSDRLYLEANQLCLEIYKTNRELGRFNDLLKRIKDYRPLSETETREYKTLDEQRKKLGARMVALEEKIDQADLRKAMGADEAVKELPPLPALSNINRPELEQQISQIENRLVNDSVELQKLLRIKNNYGWNR